MAKEINIGKIIHRKMWERHWSCPKLAKELGISAQSTAKMIKKEHLSSKRIVQVSEILDCDIIQYLYMFNNREPEPVAKMKKKMKELEFEQDSLWIWDRVLRNLMPNKWSVIKYELKIDDKYFSAYTVAELGEILKINKQAIFLPWFNKKFNQWSTLGAAEPLRGFCLVHRALGKLFRLRQAYYIKQNSVLLNSVIRTFEFYQSKYL